VLVACVLLLIFAELSPLDAGGTTDLCRRRSEGQIQTSPGFEIQLSLHSGYSKAMESAFTHRDDSGDALDRIPSLRPIQSVADGLTILSGIVRMDVPKVTNRGSCDIPIGVFTMPMAEK